jgi:hypothetical protein
MATNALPAGTRNTSLNLIDEEYQVLLNISGGKLGPFIKDTFLRGLREVDAKAAKQIQEIRNERLRMKHGIICLLIGAFAVFGSHDLRLARTVRVRSGSARVSRKEVA